MKNLSIIQKLLLFILIIGSLSSCKKDEETTARLQVSLTDAPADYEAVNVDIQSIEIHSNGNANESDKGWTTIDVLNPGVYNLLDFANGLDTLLSDVTIPAGKVSQIRLILGSNNSIVVDDESFPLSTPSAMQSGLKLKVNHVFEGGLTYKILLDFDAARSIVETGSGSYILKPVIRTIVEAETGGIKGIVNPVESNPAIYAISAQEDSVGAYPNESGEFKIQGLKAGTYRVVFVPSSNYQEKTVENVDVTVGTYTDLGTVEIE